MMTHGISNLATTPLRAAADDGAEMVSQLVFGDFVEVLSFDRPWIKVRNHSDGYEGYMDFKQLVYISEETYQEGISTAWPVVSVPQLTLAGPFGPLTIFLGAQLPFFDGTKSVLENQMYTPEITPTTQVLSITELCQHYLNAPYLWGGKSLYGIDCSGLTQNIYRAAGVQIKRDASQQVLEGKAIDWADRQAGDAVFYTTSSEKVTHVGILLSADEVIHAHGRVRIDRTDETGIFNAEQDRYTHNHHSIRRYI